MAETNLPKTQVISELTKSPHGKLEEYVPVGKRAAREDPDFFSHLVAWNHQKGQVRDAQCALPVLALTAPGLPEPLCENALAHLADFNPRMLDKALVFARGINAPTRLVRRLVERYLRDLELSPAWERVALQHRNTLKSLYARYHVKPAERADRTLFKGHGDGKFAALRTLKDLSPEEIAGAIGAHQLPFMVVRGALGDKAKHPDVVLALMARMSPTELVTNAKALERLGVKTVPALRAAFEAAVERAGKAKRGKATLKTTRAAEALDDAQLSGKLRVLQERQLDNLKGIEGNWLVLGDKSGSMAHAIEASRHVAAILARMVKGQVHLVFFDESPYYVEATGKTYEQLKAATAQVNARGATGIGCGLWALTDRKHQIDGIAIVSDGGENRSPAFAHAYQRYVQAMGNQPSVYFYRTTGDPNVLSHNCAVSQIVVTEFDLTTLDYYSLPNVVQTMRIGQFSLVEEILGTPLRRLDSVLELTKGMEVIRHARRTETAQL